MKFLTIPFLVLLFISCSSNKEIIEIKPKLVQPDIIEGALQAEGMTDIDTVIITKEITTKGDTVKYIEFRPDPQLLSKIRELQKESKDLGKEIKSLGEFYFNFKPEPIILIDTLRTIKTVIKETPFLSKLGLVALGVIVCLLVLIGINLSKKKLF